VNDIWGGDPLSEWGKPFWELDLTKGKTLLDRAIMTHIITSKYGIPLMMQSPIERGLVIEVTDGTVSDYRGNLFYDLAKHSVNRLALIQAEDLNKRRNESLASASSTESTTTTNSPLITCVGLTPGFLRSEAMLDHFGVTEANWREAIAKDPYFEGSETPYYIGQAVVALALDENVFSKSGKVLSTWALSEEYPSVVDKDGTKPHWENFFKTKKEQISSQPQQISS